MAKILGKHTESFENIIDTFQKSKVISRSPNRIRLIKEGGEDITMIRLDWNGKEKKWLLTQYVPEL